jgi:hypothetical protein
MQLAVLQKTYIRLPINEPEILLCSNKHPANCILDRMLHNKKIFMTPHSLDKNWGKQNFVSWQTV